MPGLASPQNPQDLEAAKSLFEQMQTADPSAVQGINPMDNNALITWFNANDPAAITSNMAAKMPPDQKQNLQQVTKTVDKMQNGVNTMQQDTVPGSVMATSSANKFNLKKLAQAGAFPPA